MTDAAACFGLRLAAATGLKIALMLSLLAWLWLGWAVCFVLGAG
jgi:hypothetical protein